MKFNFQLKYMKDWPKIPFPVPFFQKNKYQQYTLITLGFTCFGGVIGIGIDNVDKKYSP